MEESEIIPMGRVADVEVLVVEFGCKVGCFLTTYLGLPLGPYYKSVGVWDGVEEHLKRSLALWKR